MFGCGLPVAALAYPALAELVHDGANGALFRSAPELAAVLLRLLRGFRGRWAGQPEPPQLARLRRGAAAEAGRRWAAEWAAAAGPLFHLQ